MISHDVSHLIALFDRLFGADYNTVLVRGDAEPEYAPADKDHPQNRLIFAHGYFSSALHEIAHWCIAGAERRKLPDFGYWYRPDGRTAQQQAAFEAVEVRPQALEWIFSVAAKHPFVFSADNLNGEQTDMTAFKERVHEQVHHYLNHGMPPRAARFAANLMQEYGGQVSRTAFPLEKENI